MREMTLQAILEARDRRAENQRRLLLLHACPVISFTMNIPGPVKNSPLIGRAFQVGLERLQGLLAREGVTPLNPLLTNADTGCEYLCAVRGEASRLKAICESIEDTEPLGRLFDMDVLDRYGEKLSRREPRGCLVCGAVGKGCASRRLHSVAELQQSVKQRLEAGLLAVDGERIGTMVTEALLDEVNTTPKPGLVDRNNSGSHRDMDFFTFVDSAAALAPHFRQMYLTGWDHALDDPAALFTRLRVLGQQAEADMFAATHGVNTHKGLIFSMGLLSGAFGAKQRQGSATLDSVLALCADMGRCALGDFATAPDTNGKRCYQTYRLPGIRGEAAAGFPSAAAIGLPALRRWTEAGLSLNDASLYALLTLLAQVSDTNMIRRGGFATAEACRQQAQALLDRITPESLHQELLSLDQAYIAANLSPGGCADLLALSLFLVFIEG